MPVSGIVITLSENSGDRSALMAELEADPRLSLGELQGACHLPVVIDTDELRDGENLIRQMFRRRGVEFVDVVTVDFSDVQDFGDRPQKKKKRRLEAPADGGAV